METGYHCNRAETGQCRWRMSTGRTAMVFGCGSRDVLAGQEYRYVCRIGCGGVPMRVYNRAMSEQSWNTLEEYLDAPTVRWYGTGAESFSDFPLLAGHWLIGYWVLTKPITSFMCSPAIYFRPCL